MRKTKPKGIATKTYEMIYDGTLTIEQAMRFMSPIIIRDMAEWYEITPADGYKFLQKYGEMHYDKFGRNFIVWAIRRNGEIKFKQGDGILKQKINDGEKRATFTFDLLRDDGSVFDTVRIWHDGRKRPIERFIKKNNYVVGEECEIMIQGQMMKARLKEIVIENYY